jgi:rSAM/selenodomain-associated transferase 2/rSAM/selenodomain-associated transferase 1
MFNLIDMSGTAVIQIFTRYPVPGQAKTRLIPALGREAAALLHRRMTELTLSKARAVRTSSDSDEPEIMVCYSGSRRKNFRAWLGRDIQYFRQPSGDIGRRMEAAFKAAFQKGSKRVIAVGTDIPGLSSGILEKALTGLQNHDVVLGPAMDGGYYLIGMQSLHPELFRAWDWGTESVCNRTRATIRRLGLDLMELPLLQDSDRPENLAAMQNSAVFIELQKKKLPITVVIPTYNEEAVIGFTIEHLSQNADVEIIVADGGSRDATREIASEAGAVVLNVPGRRAEQQNAGAARATGRLLFFLHADTLPPDGYADLIRGALDNPSTVAGTFRFKTDGSGISMRLVEHLTNIRSSVFQFPYGDQGLFMEKRVFEEMGGFSPLPIMEDFELVRRLRRRGRIVTLNNPAVTSARRWVRLGVVRTTLINQTMIAGFYGKVPIPALERFYRAAAGRSGKEIDSAR